MREHVFRLQASQIPPAPGASTSERDSLAGEPAAGGHFLGGYWIGAAVVVIALLTAYYRRRWRRAVKKS